MSVVIHFHNIAFTSLLVYRFYIWGLGEAKGFEKSESIAVRPTIVPFHTLACRDQIIPHIRRTQKEVNHTAIAHRNARVAAAYPII